VTPSLPQWGRQPKGSIPLTPSFLEGFNRAQTFNAYNLNMAAVKRIPVTEPVCKDLAEMRSAGQTYTDLPAEMIEERKKRGLEEDLRKWTSRKKKDFVSLSEIKD